MRTLRQEEEEEILIREGMWGAVQPAEGQQVDPEASDRALATICLTLEKNNFSLVQTATSAQDAWEKLRKAFQDDGLIRRFGLLNRLTSVKLENYSSVEDYVDNLVSTANDLSEIGFEVNDRVLASLLMKAKGLSEYYHPIVMGRRRRPAW